MKSRTILLLGNGSNGNRGCESIARGTVAMFAEAGVPLQIRSGVIVSDDTQAAAVNNHAPLPGEPPQFPLRIKPSRAISDRIRARLPGGRTTFVVEGLKPHLERADLVLEVGGDNYTLDYGPPWAFVDMDKLSLARGLPTFIWGASVGPFDAMPSVDAFMMRHLNSLAGVMVRESISYNDLVRNGVANCERMTDPSIFMDPEAPANAGFDTEAFDGAIGVNISPFMANAITAKNCAFWDVAEVDLAVLADFGAELVRRMLQAWPRPIVLLPHVFGPAGWNDDHRLMSAVCGRLNDSERIRVALPLRSLTAPNLKWIASKCSVFIGSRTHATLAAISTGVPTLAFGYSRKAKGLISDLYGSDMFCIPSADLTLERVLHGIDGLISGEDALRLEISNRLHEWRNLGRAAVRHVLNYRLGV